MATMDEDLQKSGLTKGDLPNFVELDDAETNKICGKRVASYRIGYKDIDGNDLLVNGAPFFRLRFLDPKAAGMRYWTAPGDPAGGVHLYIPLSFWDALRTSRLAVVVIVEGEKKAEAGCKAGIPTVAVPGIWMYRDQQAKARLQEALTAQLKSAADAVDALRNSPDIPVSPEILELIRRAKEARPALIGVLILFDNDGKPLAPEEMKEFSRGKMFLTKNVGVFVHPTTKEAFTVANPQVAQAGWLFAESLRRQLPGEWRLPVMNDFCPLRFENDGDNRFFRHLGLDDWIVEDGADSVVNALYATITPLLKMSDLLDLSELFGPRLDPALLGGSGKMSPENLFLMLLDKEQVGEYEGVLYLWKKTHWSVVEDKTLFHAASAFLRTVFPAKMTDRTLKSIAYCTGKADGLYAIPTPKKSEIRVALRDYVAEIDHATGEVRQVEGDKRHGLRHAVEADWSDKDKPTPLWDGFIQKILPDSEVRRLVLEYLGYTLLSDTRFQVAQFWVGSGANGKSTLAEIVAAVHQKTVSVSIEDLGGFAAGAIIGASLVTVDETPPRIDEQRLKSMISGDPVSIDRKFKELVTVCPTAKWIIRGNSAPQVSDQTDGFWRRLHVIDFTTKIPEDERDDLLAEKIVEQELGGVVFQILSHLSNLLRRGRFGELPKAVQETKRRMRTETNSLLGWVDTFSPTIGDREQAVPSDSVYQHYRRWCQDNGYSPVAVNKFWMQLQMHMPGVDKWQARAVDPDTGDSRVTRLCNVVLDAPAPFAEQSVRLAGGAPKVVPLRLPPAS